MNEEEDRAERKKKVLEEWWIPDKIDFGVFGFVFLFNLMLGLKGSLGMGQSLILALVTCMIWIPVGTVLAYFIIKKWG